MKPYYKKIDKSFFKYGITIPNDYINDLLYNSPLVLGTAREIKILWHGMQYNAKICHVNIKKANSVHQIRWDSNLELQVELKKEFIQSYIAIFSQEIEYRQKAKYHITKLLGGSQEVIIFKPIDNNTIELETFIKIDTPYNKLFERMIEENVFGWLSLVDKKDFFIQKQTKWFDITELKNHIDSIYVIYYLLDEVNNKIYIGSAKNLGARVYPGRTEIPNWNKFRYDILQPEYHSKLRTLEYFSILSFARLLNNSGNISTLGISDLTLVNKDYKYYII